MSGVSMVGLGLNTSGTREKQCLVLHVNTSVVSYSKALKHTCSTGAALKPQVTAPGVNGIRMFLAFLSKLTLIPVQSKVDLCFTFVV